MELTGEITSIIYQNEINSYTIAEMYVDEIDGKEDNLITIVGYLPFVVEGDELKIVGKFVEHKEYGRQFKVDTFEKLMPQTLEALERYLGNGMIKGVGPATARKIINTFGEDTINVIKFQPLKLSQIKGITKEKALEIAESFIEHWEVWQIVGFLERFGIGAENSKRVYDELGINAIEQIEANPYILIDIARGVDFKQVDKMAMDLGIEENNDKRVKSAIKYALIRITYNGHCCTLEENLIEYVRSLLGISLDDIEINEVVVPKGTYLYAQMSGFGSQRVKGSVKSILIHDELIKVNLSIYDTDGLEGLYVPSSSFRETSKDVASGAMSNTSSLTSSNTSGGNALTQWGNQAISNIVQKTSNAIGKSIKKNSAKLKYGTFVYLINGKEKKKN